MASGTAATVQQSVERRHIPRFPYKRLPGRFSGLLILLVIFLLAYPFAMEGSYWKPLGLLAGLAVLAAAYSLSDHHRLWLISMVFAVPSLIHRLSLRPGLETRFDMVGLICSIAFDLFMTGFILYVIFRHESISSETIYGALCAYLTVGYAFANIFLLLVHFLPASIYMDPIVNSHKIAQRADLIYYSFASLTCMGSNGIAPANSYARSLTSFESVIGVMYLAVLVARLIGLHTAQRRA